MAHTKTKTVNTMEYKQNVIVYMSANGCLTKLLLSTSQYTDACTLDCLYVNLCCLHLKIEFCSCARGRQWCVIFITTNEQLKKPEAAIFPCRLCFLMAFPFLSLIMIFAMRFCFYDILKAKNIRPYLVNSATQGIHDFLDYGVPSGFTRRLYSDNTAFA